MDKEDIKNIEKIREVQREKAQSDLPFNSYIYSAIPIGADPHVQREYWAFVNKQLALANHTGDDVESILNRLRIIDLETKSKLRRYELRSFEKVNRGNYSNTRVFVQSLASLGKDMALIKEMGKSRKEITVEDKPPEPKLRKIRIGG